MIDVSSSQAIYKDLRNHIGHEVELAGYGLKDKVADPDNIAIECMTCSEVLVEGSADNNDW